MQDYTSKCENIINLLRQILQDNRCPEYIKDAITFLLKEVNNEITETTNS